MSASLVYDREDGSRVFETGDHIHNPPQIYQASENPHMAGEESLDTQLERHLNRGEVQGDLDAVDRTEWPETPVLEAEFMGQGIPFTPPTAAGTSTNSRPPHPPIKKPGGARS